jgi:hypothetical protein
MQPWLERFLFCHRYPEILLYPAAFTHGKPIVNVKQNTKLGFLRDGTA